MTAAAELLDDDRLAAGVDMIGRTGATSVGTRYSDDETPTVWLAVAEFPQRASAVGGSAFGISAPRWEAAAGHDPLEATLRLCEQLIDGGMCAKCGRLSGFEPDDITTMPLDDEVCWYQYDPGRKRYTQGCVSI